MLQFFRKYQRIVFIFVSVVVILSFTFFGTYSAFVDDNKAPDRLLAKAIDGSAIMQREVDMLSYFLSHDSDEKGLNANIAMLNLLNDNVIRKDFLMTGMGAILAEKYFEVLKNDLQSRLDRVQRYKPYTHPQAPFLSAMEAWKQFAPNTNLHLSLIKEKGKEPTSETFAMLAHLYLDQTKLPPELLKHILTYQQNQFSWLQKDPMLEQGDHALFGFHSMEEWFGPKYVKLVAQFIINSSLIAEQKGYRVSKEEARADLIQNLSTALSAFAQDSNFSTDEAAKFFPRQVQLFGMNESSIVSLWQKVMLFRKYFYEAGNSVFLDPLAYREFSKYAQETVEVDSYCLPKAMQLQDFSSLMKFQLYLESVSSSKNRNSLVLPSSFLLPEEVEKRAPQLVQRRFLVEVAHANIEELSQKVSLKETWEWEVDEKNWDILKNEFPVLATKDSKTRQERFLALEKLDDKMRTSIDGFARKQILARHPGWIEEALQKAPGKTMELKLSSKGQKGIIDGIKDTSALIAHLSALPIKVDSESAAPKEKNSQYSEDGKIFYQFAVLKRSDKKEIVTFEQVINDGILDELLEKRLEESYPEVRKKDAGQFQLADGNWKPLSNVKELVGARLYADLLKAIEGAAPKSENKATLPLEFYANNRFYAYMKEAKKHLTQNPQDPKWVREENTEKTEGSDNTQSLADQWLLVKTHLDVKRSDETPFVKEDLFTLPDGAWSAVASKQLGNMAFFHLLQKKQQNDTAADNLQEGHKILSMDARRALMEKTLQLIADKGAIDLSYYEAKAE